MSNGFMLFMVCTLFFVSGFFFGTGLISYCHSNRFPISKYAGNVVVGKGDSYITIDSCGLRRDIYCINYELSSYNLGDTIK